MLPPPHKDHEQQRQQLPEARRSKAEGVTIKPQIEGRHEEPRQEDAGPVSSSGTAQRHCSAALLSGKPDPMVLGVMTHTVQMAAMRETEETTSMHSSQFVSVVTATYGSSQLSDAVAKDWIVSTSTFVAEAAQHRHAPHISWATGGRLSVLGHS